MSDCASEDQGTTSDSHENQAEDDATGCERENENPGENTGRNANTDENTGRSANTGDDDETALVNSGRGEESEQDMEPEDLMCDPSEPSNESPQERDWATIADALLRPRGVVSTDIFGEEFMRVPEDRIFTMDAVSKCWAAVARDSPALLVDETEGGSWAFCEACVAQIPKTLQSFLFFFHMLAADIEDLRHYAVPSQNVSLRKKRGEKMKIADLIWHKPYEAGGAGGDLGCAGDEVDMNEIMCERGRNNARSQNATMKIAPFKVRLGFTGAIFRHNGEEQRKLIAVLVVTWARNWDMLGYIQDHFLRDPPKGVSYKQRMSEKKAMNLIWKTMSRFVAFKNLGLDKTKVGKPDHYADQPGGKLGRDSLFNLFQIPFQIYGIVKQEVYERMRRSDPKITLKDVRLESLDVIGLPRLSFRRDEVTQDYVAYMHAYVTNMSNLRAEFMRALKDYNKPREKEAKAKDGKKDKTAEVAEQGEEDPEGESMFTVYKLDCAGGWPLERCGRMYTKFGLPRLPLWLEFEPEFKPDFSTSMDNWLADLGGSNGIPELVKTCLRSFLVQDLGATQESIWQTWDHFLRDQRPADPSLVLSEYYGDKADPLSSLVTAGYLRAWWVGVKKDIQAQRARGLGVRDASQSLKRYLLSSSYYHRSSIHAGAFRSQRIIQALSIVEKANFRRVCQDVPAEGQEGAGAGTSIRAMIRQLNATVSNERRFDPYLRCNEAFYRCFELLNRGFMMNSSNLEFMIEVMISQLLWMFGPNNETVVAYFQGVQQMAGNGHFLLTTKDGTYPDIRKPNSTGLDWTHGRLTELYQMLLDLYGIMDPKQNLQTPLNCMGWTPASIPLLTTATITDGQIESLPDQTLGLRSIIATEIRGDSVSMLIRGVFPRNSDGQEQFMINTCDPDNTNKRKTQIKRKFTDLQFCALGTNVPDTRSEDAEMTKTLSTVLQVMPPGSGPSMRRQKTGALNNVTCSVFGFRQGRQEQREGIANFLPFTHVWATAIPSLMNKTNVVPAEISPTTIALLDWIFFYAKEVTEGMLQKSVAESFKRMKDGYEARQVAKALWVKTIMFLSEADSNDDATERILQSMFSNALPAHEAVACVHSFLTRGLHMGALLMVSCIAKHLEVPIVSLESLVRFFDSDGEAAAPEDVQTHELIRRWLVKCVQRNRVCPENVGPMNPASNASIYITSDGDGEGLPTSDKDTMLRVKKTRLQTQDDVHQAVGKRIKDLWGRALFETCHMGPEQCVYSNAIMDLMVNWLPDCRQLLSEHIFASKRHLRKLGLEMQLPGVPDWPAECERPPPFARSFMIFPPGGQVRRVGVAVLAVRVWLSLKARPARLTQGRWQEPAAMCVGVHAFSLLLCVSLAGAPTLHPKISSNVARTLLREILRHAPPSATPGNNALVRSFNLHTTMAERVIVPKQARPLHFPRPVDDWNFANSGQFTFSRAIGRFLPEDAMHCGGLFHFAELYGCDILELPGKEVQVEYELLASTYYSVWRERDSAYGTLFVSVRSAMVEVQLVLESGEETAMAWDYEEWHAGLRKNELIITPMIWRHGACVENRLSSGGRELACVVPPPPEEQAQVSTPLTNFLPSDCSYFILAREDAPARKLHFHKVLRRLVEVGREVYIRLTNPGVQKLALQLARIDRAKEYLCGRLNVPTMEQPEPGKVFVTCLQRPVFARSDASDIACLTLPLDPWDVALDLPEGAHAAKTLAAGSA